MSHLSHAPPNVKNHGKFYYTPIQSDVFAIEWKPFHTPLCIRIVEGLTKEESVKLLSKLQNVIETIKCLEDDNEDCLEEEHY